MATFWMIEESVTPQGHYITLPGIYNTASVAGEAICKLNGQATMRAAPYQTGRSGQGPERFRLSRNV